MALKVLGRWSMLEPKYFNSNRLVTLQFSRPGEFSLYPNLQSKKHKKK